MDIISSLPGCAGQAPDCQEGPKAERKARPYHLQISPATARHMEAVFSIVRDIYGREHYDLVDYEANLRYVKNLFWITAGQFFRETGKLISGQTEITGVNTIDFKELTWMSTSLLCSRAYQ